MNPAAAQAFFSAVPLTIALIHFFLFVFEPRGRRNLYFALLAAAFGGLAWMDLEELLSAPPRPRPLEILSMLLVPLLLLSILRFIYSLFYERLPRVYSFFLGAVAVYLLLLPIDKDVAELYGMVVAVVSILETFRVIITRYRRQDEDLFLPTVGTAAFALFALGDMLLDLGVVRGPIAGTTNPYLIGGLIMLLAMSIHLARDFARQGRSLEAQLAKVTELSARSLEQERAIRDEEVRRRVAESEASRRGEELAEARALQLSMLPSSPPEVEGWDIAAEMLTASEVGGDYYDFHPHARGALLVIGDAVGHGARAGTIVTAVKSAFSLLRDETSVVRLMEGMDRALRGMELRRAHMSLTALRLEGGRAVISSAGMPPVLIRRQSGRVEEIVTPRTPLGSMAMPFSSREVAIGPGDLILLMTDGLPELRTGADSVLGYERIAEMVAAAEGSTATEIVRHLLDEVDGTIDDDITLIALRRV